MDSLTQAVYGAVIGQAGFQRRLGRRSLAWGAVAGTLPDLDVIANLVAGPLAEHSFHRGPTHSLLFAGVAGTAIGLLVARWHRRRAARRTPRVAAGVPGSIPGSGPGGDPGSGPGSGSGSGPGDTKRWVALFVVVFATHALLDAFTGYGTQLWLPFSRERVAWHGLAIIDPLFTVPLLAALLIGAVAGYRRRLAIAAAAVALALATGYQFWTLTWHDRARERVTRTIADAGWTPAAVFVTPMPPVSLLRRAVVLTDEAVHVGFFSLAAPADAGRWESAPRRRDPAVAAVLSTPQGQVFEWFAAGMTAGRVVDDGEGRALVRIDDLRFGVPGAPADTGLWGIEAPVAEAAGGSRAGPVGRFERAPALGEGAVAWLWQALTAGFAHAGPPPAGGESQPAGPEPGAGNGEGASDRTSGSS